MAIRPDTDPKSAAPRSGAPKGELEQYGVWVKAEPQDVIEEIQVPASGDFDFDVPGDTASLPEESFLSEDEEKLLGSFDADFETPSLSSSGESGPLPDIEDMPPLEESLLSSDPSPMIEEVEDIGAGSIDINLEDIESSRPSPTIHPSAELDMDTIEGLDSPIAPSEPSSPAPAEYSGDSGAIEDVSSEFLDMAEEPRAEGAGADFGSDLDDVTSQFLDADEAVSLPAEAAPSADFEPLDIDLQFDDSSAGASAARPRQAAEDPGFEAVTEFDDFLSADAGEASKPKAGMGGDFDDVSAVERELSAPSAEPTQPSPRAEQKPDLSTEILLKIAQELSSIRGELVSLKSKIGEAIVGAEPSASRGQEPPAEEIEAPGPSGGFFDEEEDETIALTGDELDNILNTADFTEETVESGELVDLDLEGGADDFAPPTSPDLLDETLLPESGDYSSPDAADAEPAIEEVRIGEAASVDEVDALPLGPELEDLNLVVEEGITPMTSAPEDTSYLEGSETLDLGEPMNDGPLVAEETLVEPDLSDFDLDSEDLEPRLEIDEELPLASSSPDFAEEEITLGIDAGPGYAAEESAVEAEMVESLPEIEEPNFSEINLHEEDLAPAFPSEPTDLEEIEFLPDSDLGTSPSPEPPARGAEPPLEEEDLVLAAEEPEEPTSEAIAVKEAPIAAAPAEPASSKDGDRLKSEIKSVLSYLDKLLDSLPEEKIEEFARSEYFDTYKKLFEELGLV